ncbi:MAG: hypothetical protein Kow0090_22370 [Myxococcota bacterium]
MSYYIIKLKVLLELLWRYFKLILPLAVSATIIGWLVLNLDFKAIRDALSGASLLALFLALTLSLFSNFYLGPTRLKLLTEKAGKRLSLKESAVVILGNEPITFFVPMKGGDFLTALYLKFQKNFTLPQGVFIILADKTASLFAVTIFFLLGALAIEDFFLALFSLALLFPLALLYFTPAQFIKPFSALVSAVSRRIGGALLDSENQFFQATLREKIAFLFIALAFFFCEIAGGFIILRDLGIPAEFGAVVCVLSGMIVVSALPVSVAGLGIREITLISFFAGNADREKALAGSLTIFTLFYLFPALIGLAFTSKFLRGIIGGR